MPKGEVQQLKIGEKKADVQAAKDTLAAEAEEINRQKDSVQQELSAAEYAEAGMGTTEAHEPMVRLEVGESMLRLEIHSNVEGEKAAVVDVPEKATVLVETFSTVSRHMHALEEERQALEWLVARADDEQHRRALGICAPVELPAHLSSAFGYDAGKAGPSSARGGYVVGKHWAAGGSLRPPTGDDGNEKPFVLRRVTLADEETEETQEEPHESVRARLRQELRRAPSRRQKAWAPVAMDGGELLLRDTNLIPAVDPVPGDRVQLRPSWSASGFWRYSVFWVAAKAEEIKRRAQPHLGEVGILLKWLDRAKTRRSVAKIRFGEPNAGIVLTLPAHALRLQPPAEGAQPTTASSIKDGSHGKE
eukprot:807653-Prymnesium_polylepis.1